MTCGGCVALMVPISGMVTWKSESTSSRNASNSSSARSTSSISSTGERVLRDRLQQRPLEQERLGEDLALFLGLGVPVSAPPA